MGQFNTTHVMSRDVFMSVPNLELVEPVLRKIIIKPSEMNSKNKILLFKPVSLYMRRFGE